MSILQRVALIKPINALQVIDTLPQLYFKRATVEYPYTYEQYIDFIREMLLKKASLTDQIIFFERAPLATAIGFDNIPAATALLI